MAPTKRAKKKESVKPETVRAKPSRGEMLRLAGVVLGRLRKQPGMPVRHLIAFAKEWLRILRGRSEVAAAPGDRRFADAGWTDGRVSKTLMQTYLAACNEAYAVVRELELEGRDASSARFLATTLVEALAPSNLPFTNPMVMKAARQSRGKTLLRGFQHFLSDQLDNDGMISMVDRTAFEVGRNVATTPGEVVYRNDILELIQYKPQTAEVYARPLMIVPPQINKFYVLDLSPQNSLANYLVAKGFQVFMVSWRNPNPEHREWSMADYVQALEGAHTAAMEITGSPDINFKGLCAGGLTASIALARYAAQKRLHTVKSLTLNVTLLDVGGLEQTNLGFFVNPQMLEMGRAQAKKDGVLYGHKMAKMFAWIRPNDLVWNYWVNNCLMGQKPAAFDVLYWNSDATRLPAALLSDFIDLAIDNPFGHDRPWALPDAEIDLKKVTVDQFVVAGRTDHITPWNACYNSVNILGGKSEFVLVNSGHIQTLVCPPGKGKATYQTASITPEDPQDWLAASKAITGSWWEHWSPWLAERSGDKRPAPKALGSAKYTGLGSAPGTYVRE
ncbi:MAG: alpha/beta fold hydrolase [Panacagrimonas sp.]